MRLIPLVALLAILTPLHGGATTSDAWSSIPDPSEGEAEAIGGYANGCLSGGEALPPECRGYQVVRLSRNRYYGHPVLIDYIRDLGNKVADNELGLMLVADMNQPRGGPMLSGHASHQIGLDADIWLTPMPNRRLSVSERANMSAVSMLKKNSLYVDPKKWSPARGKLLARAASTGRRVFVFFRPKGANEDARWNLQEMFPAKEAVTT